MIREKLLKKYHMKTLEEYFNDLGESKNTRMGFYETFLIQTDHIPNKIIEAQILGETVEDYTEILNARKFAREQINKLNGEE